jgi:Leucine-rich repeat (LRR) protein
MSEKKRPVFIQDDSVHGPKSKFKFSGKITNYYKPLPDELFRHTNLKVLDISTDRVFGINYHSFEFVPMGVFKLINLKVLHCDLNSIMHLPKEIGNLRNLEYLTLTHNKLTQLPESFIKLEKLRSLHLGNNKFEQFPLVICYLKSLVFLDISSNKIDSIPDQIRNLGETLQTLILVNNRIKEFPNALCDCTKLETLWLGANDIEFLPKNMFLLKNLDWKEAPLMSSCINGNPMKHPPMKICLAGLDEILNYMKNHNRND